MADDGQSTLYDLNLGAAKTHIPGFINIDIHERADISLDLGVDKLPFPDNSVRTVVSHHTLEHVPNYLFALGEIHRVLRHDGELLLSLPYATLTEHHLVNPYHHHNFTERSFDFFDPLLLKGSAAEEGDTAFRSVLVRFSYIGLFGAAPRWFRVWARRHLLNVVRQFDIVLIAIKDPDRPVDVSKSRARELEARLMELKRMRTPYAPAGSESQAIDGAWPAEQRRRPSPSAPTGVLRVLRRGRDALGRRSEIRYE
jgi:SAM-dependent methyltransferase